jgi:ribosomal protein S18 acetylase RimI-like enzyme
LGEEASMSTTYSESDVDALVELDRLNMSPLIEAGGGHFDPAFRRKKLLQEIEGGAAVRILRRERKVVAYLEYKPEEDGRWRILSIQVHPDHRGGGLLRELLGLAAKAARKGGPGRVVTSVHVGNKPSISLHERLGFRRIGGDGDRLVFEVAGDTLRRHLTRFERTPRRRPRGSPAGPVK